METIIKMKEPANQINWKAKLFFASVFCFIALFLLSVFLVGGWKHGDWTLPVFLVNLTDHAFFIFSAILSLFRLQLVFPSIFELRLDIQLFENIKNFL